MITLSIEPSITNRIKIFDIPDVGDHEKWTFEIDKTVPKYDVVLQMMSLLKLYLKNVRLV